MCYRKKIKKTGETIRKVGLKQLNIIEKLPEKDNEQSHEMKVLNLDFRRVCEIVKKLIEFFNFI